MTRGRGKKVRRLRPERSAARTFRRRRSHAVRGLADEPIGAALVNVEGKTDAPVGDLATPTPTDSSSPSFAGDRNRDCNDVRGMKTFSDRRSVVRSFPRRRYSSSSAFSK